MSPVGSVMCFAATCDTGQKFSRRAGVVHLHLCVLPVYVLWLGDAGSGEILPGQDLVIYWQYCHLFIYENAVEGC